VAKDSHKTLYFKNVSLWKFSAAWAGEGMAGGSGEARHPMGPEATRQIGAIHDRLEGRALHCAALVAGVAG